MVSVAMFYTREGLHRDTYGPHGSEHVASTPSDSILSMEKVVNEGMAEESGDDVSVQKNWITNSDPQILRLT